MTMQWTNFQIPFGQIAENYSQVNYDYEQSARVRVRIRNQCNAKQNKS